MILETPKKHFDEDIQRAAELLDHAKGIGDSELKRDIMRSSWMMGVGALDAYFCDAYGDLIARTLRAKEKAPTVSLKSKFENILIPAIVVIRNNPREGWKWRMVARNLIEKDSVLSIGKIKNLFNQFCHDSRKLLSHNSNSFAEWIEHEDSKVRMFGMTPTEFRKKSGSGKNKAKKEALIRFEKRFKTIFQRRHDCIHNCDRPKIAIISRNITETYLEKVIFDIRFLVERCQEDLKHEFPLFLKRAGFDAITRNSVGC